MAPGFGPGSVPDADAAGTTDWGVSRFPGGRFALLGRRFFRGSLERAGALMVDGALAARRTGKGSAVHVVNAHTLVEGRGDPELGRAQDEADLLLPDGRPLSLAAKLLGDFGAGQVRGPDLMRWLAREGREAGLKHYFYGGAPGVAAAVADSLGAKFPGLKSAGAESPPFGEPEDAALGALVGRLRSARADFLWLGLGAPKQERTLARLKRLGCPCVMLGVGAAFDYEAGAKAEAPAWMRGAGLEWAFRLADEPGRLWRRYASTNPRFVGLFLLEALGLGPWRQGTLERACRLCALACLSAAPWVAGTFPKAALCLSAAMALGLAAARRAGGALNT